MSSSQKGLLLNVARTLDNSEPLWAGLVAATKLTRELTPLPEQRQPAGPVQPDLLSAAKRWPGCASPCSLSQVRVFTSVQSGQLWAGLNELPENILALSYPVRYAAGAVAIFLSPHNEGLEPFQELTGGDGGGGAEKKGETEPRDGVSVWTSSLPSLMSFLHFEIFFFLQECSPSTHTHDSEARCKPCYLCF